MSSSDLSASPTSDPDSPTTTSDPDSTPTSASSDDDDSSPSSTPTSSTPSPPLITTNGSAAVSETITFTSDGNLNTSQIPTTAPAKQADSTSLSWNQTDTIVALIAGLSALILILLLAFVLIRRHRRRSHHHRQRLPQSVDDNDIARPNNINLVPATTSFTAPQYDSAAAAAAAIYRPSSPSLSILRSRVSESGSIFREEVWPPPSPSIDPIQMRSSQVDLSRIVDDVMGPPVPDKPEHPVSKKTHKRALTENSTTPLLVQTSSGHDSSEEDFSQAYTSPSSSDSPTSPTSPPIADPPPSNNNNRPFGAHPESFPLIFQTTQPQSYNSLRHSSSSTASFSSSFHSTPGGPPIHIPSPSSFRPLSTGSVHDSIASTTTFQRTQPKISSPLVRAPDGVWRQA